MTRLSPLVVLDAAQRALADSVTASRGVTRVPGQPLPGPFEAWLRAPRPGLAAARLGEALGETESLTAAERELAILVVAAHYRAAVVFAAHARLARRAGVDAEMVEAIRAGRPRPDSFMSTVAGQLVAAGRLDADTYEQAAARWGEAGLAELVLTVGYYVLVALTVNVVEADLPAGVDPVW